MAEVNCQVEVPNIANSGASNVGSQLTVGDVFFLICRWPAAASSLKEPAAAPLLKEPLELRLDKQDQYKLDLIRFTPKDSQEFQLMVRSLKPGKHQLNAVQLVDANSSVVLNPIQFEVQSILNPNEKTEPYGPMGPISLGYPLLLWVIAASVLLMAVSILSVLMWRRWRVRKWMQQMGFEKSTQQASTEFYFQVRRLSRKTENPEMLFAELQKSVLFYLGRQFQLPTYFLAPRKILSFIEKDLRRFMDDDQRAQEAHLEKTIKELRSFFAEASRIKKGLQLSMSDFQQLLSQARHIVDGIEIWKRNL